LLVCLFCIAASEFQFQTQHFLFLWQAPQSTSLPKFMNCFLRRWNIVAIC
jgi:hypothetical protein